MDRLLLYSRRWIILGLGQTCGESLQVAGQKDGAENASVCENLIRSGQGLDKGTVLGEGSHLKDLVCKVRTDIPQLGLRTGLC